MNAYNATNTNTNNDDTKTNANNNDTKTMLNNNDTKTIGDDMLTANNTSHANNTNNMNDTNVTNTTDAHNDYVSSLLDQQRSPSSASSSLFLHHRRHGFDKASAISDKVAMEQSSEHKRKNLTTASLLQKLEENNRIRRLMAAAANPNPNADTVKDVSAAAVAAAVKGVGENPAVRAANDSPSSQQHLHQHHHNHQHHHHDNHHHSDNQSPPQQQHPHPHHHHHLQQRLSLEELKARHEADELLAAAKKRTNNPDNPQHLNDHPPPNPNRPNPYHHHHHHELNRHPHHLTTAHNATSVSESRLPLSTPTRTPTRAAYEEYDGRTYSYPFSPVAVAAFPLAANGGGDEDEDEDAVSVGGTLTAAAGNAVIGPHTMEALDRMVAFRRREILVQKENAGEREENAHGANANDDGDSEEASLEQLSLILSDVKRSEQQQQQQQHCHPDDNTEDVTMTSPSSALLSPPRPDPQNSQPPPQPTPTRLLATNAASPASSTPPPPPPTTTTRRSMEQYDARRSAMLLTMTPPKKGGNNTTAAADALTSVSTTTTAGGGTLLPLPTSSAASNGGAATATTRDCISDHDGEGSQQLTKHTATAASELIAKASAAVPNLIADLKRQHQAELAACEAHYQSEMQKMDLHYATMIIRAMEDERQRTEAEILARNEFKLWWLAEAMMNEKEKSGGGNTAHDTTKVAVGRGRGGGVKDGEGRGSEGRHDDGDGDDQQHRQEGGEAEGAPSAAAPVSTAAVNAESHTATNIDTNNNLTPPATTKPPNLIVTENDAGAINQFIHEQQERVRRDVIAALALEFESELQSVKDEAKKQAEYHATVNRALQAELEKERSERQRIVSSMTSSAEERLSTQEENAKAYEYELLKKVAVAEAAEAKAAKRAETLREALELLEIQHLHLNSVVIPSLRAERDALSSENEAITLKNNQLAEANSELEKALESSKIKAKALEELLSSERVYFDVNMNRLKTEKEALHEEKSALIANHSAETSKAQAAVETFISTLKTEHQAEIQRILSEVTEAFDSLVADTRREREQYADTLAANEEERVNQKVSARIAQLVQQFENLAGVERIRNAESGLDFHRHNDYFFCNYPIQQNGVNDHNSFTRNAATAGLDLPPPSFPPTMNYYASPRQQKLAYEAEKAAREQRRYAELLTFLQREQQYKQKQQHEKGKSEGESLGGGGDGDRGGEYGGRGREERIMGLLPHKEEVNSFVSSPSKSLFGGLNSFSSSSPLPPYHSPPTASPAAVAASSAAAVTSSAPLLSPPPPPPAAAAVELFFHSSPQEQRAILIANDVNANKNAFYLCSPDDRERIVVADTDTENGKQKEKKREEQNKGWNKVEEDYSTHWRIGEKPRDEAIAPIALLTNEINGKLQQRRQGGFTYYSQNEAL